MSADLTTYTNEYTCPWCWYVHRKPSWSRGCTGCGKEVANWKAAGKTVIFYPDRGIEIDESILLPVWREGGNKIPWDVPKVVPPQSPVTPPTPASVKSPGVPGLGYKVPAPAPSPAPSAAQRRREDPVENQCNPDEWTCTKCTFSNAATASECALCLSSNPDPLKEMEIALGMEVNADLSKELVQEQAAILAKIERKFSRKEDFQSG